MLIDITGDPCSTGELIALRQQALSEQYHAESQARKVFFSSTCMVALIVCASLGVNALFQWQTFGNFVGFYFCFVLMPLGAGVLAAGSHNQSMSLVLWVTILAFGVLIPVFVGQVPYLADTGMLSIAFYYVGSLLGGVMSYLYRRYERQAQAAERELDRLSYSKKEACLEIDSWLPDQTIEVFCRKLNKKGRTPTVGEVEAMRLHQQNHEQAKEKVAKSRAAEDAQKRLFPDAMNYLPDNHPGRVSR